MNRYIMIKGTIKIELQFIDTIFKLIKEYAGKYE